METFPLEYGMLQKINAGDIILYSSKAKTEKPRTWTRKERCPSCKVSQGSHHSKNCRVVYIIQTPRE
jgi:hypothetical protein